MTTPSLRESALVASALALVSCSDDGAAPGPANDPVAVMLDEVVSGLSAPVHLTAPPGDTERLFVVERGGRIRIVEGGGAVPTPFLDVSAAITTAGNEQGLLSLAFHPSYATNGFFYVDYTDTSGDTRVVRYTVSPDPDVADPASALEILSIEQPFVNHNGGLLAFGPDGMLYVGLGDGGSGGDPQDHGQRPETLLGSLLRLDVDAAAPYAIPPDNPFVDGSDAREETWAYGLRNPWRFSFDRRTGDLYIADVGQSEREEVSFQPSSSPGGENYGWRIMEGTACFDPPTGCSTAGLTQPIHEYGHDEGCSITGGHVYRGSDHPELDGRYFFADFCSTWIRSFTVNDGVAEDVQDHEDDFGPVPSISSFGEDGRGELYVVSLQGSIYRISAP